MSLKTGDLVRTRTGKVGSVVSIGPDRTVIVAFEDHGARYRLADLKLIGSDARVTVGAR